MKLIEIKEILREASVEVDIQGRKHLALFESDFERVAIKLVEKSTKQYKKQLRIGSFSPNDCNIDITRCPKCKSTDHSMITGQPYKCRDCGNVW